MAWTLLMTMPMRTLLCFVLLASAACAGSSDVSAVSVPLTTTGASVHAAQNPNAAFDRYMTFTFGSAEGPPVGYQTSARTAEVRRRLQPLITAALEQKGYTPATSGKGDIVIMFGSGRREVQIHESSDDIAGEWMPDDENADFTEGSLVIDAFDGNKGGKIWHGASHANINPDQIDDKNLQHSVQELIAKFPPVALQPRH